MAALRKQRQRNDRKVPVSPDSGLSIRVAERRARNGWTYKEVEYAAEKKGHRLMADAVRKVEKGVSRKPHLQTILALAAAFEVDVNYLMNGGGSLRHTRMSYSYRFLDASGRQVAVVKRHEAIVVSGQWSAIEHRSLTSSGTLTNFETSLGTEIAIHHEGGGLRVVEQLPAPVVEGSTVGGELRYLALDAFTDPYRESISYEQREGSFGVQLEVQFDPGRCPTTCVWLRYWLQCKERLGEVRVSNHQAVWNFEALPGRQYVLEWAWPQ